ncbi:MAG TPA: DUF1343 domain-containing protein [Verrucomicrobiae bacterium]|nr:DUF1343 domain-containing protein [Verrucomicrobiae bacterium]
MKITRYTVFLLPITTLLLTGCPHNIPCSSRPAAMSSAPTDGGRTAPIAPVKLGVEVLFEKHLDLIRGKRIGLITNPGGVDSHLDSIVELFRRQPDVHLVALYGPEHGVRGDAQAGKPVAFYYDEHFHLPVFSLYGQTYRPPADMLTNIDQYMRSYDTQQTGKTPVNGALSGIDVMVYDLPDVGTRVYTFEATLAYAMQACANAGIPIIVLDRPNPIGGVSMEGPILDYPKYSSFIGLTATPLRHGFTMGELALFYNDNFLKKKADVNVVPMENWKRDEWFDQTGLPWVMPSPNMPPLDSAIVYPGQVMLEGTDLSEGRGTTHPFEIFGAPWIDGYLLAEKLNALHLPGVKFREIWFTPTFSKFQNQLCGGCQIHVINRDKYQAIATTLNILATIKQLYGDRLEFHATYFDKVLGNSTVRAGLESGEPVDQIIAAYQPGLDAFAKSRQKYLLYH